MHDGRPGAIVIYRTHFTDEETGGSRDAEQLAQHHQEMEIVPDIEVAYQRPPSLTPFGQGLDLSRYLFMEDDFISGKLRLVLDMGVSM